MRAERGKKKVCRSNDSNEFEWIVSDYIANRRRNVEAGRRWFVIQPTLEGAVSTAAPRNSPAYVVAISDAVADAKRIVEKIERERSGR
jgi:hypothetical protein